MTTSNNNAANSVNTAVKAHVGRPFPVGKSGNPKGRPKLTQEEIDLVNACKSKALDALTVLESLMYNAKTDQVKLNAALAILDRGFGKPKDVHEFNSPDSGVVMPAVVFYLPENGRS